MTEKHRARGPLLRRQAVALLRRGQPRRAQALLERALEEEPGHVGALTNLGAARRAQGDLAGAIDCYRRALVRDPGSAATGFNLANALKQSGRFDEAVTVYRQVLASDPGNVRALNNMGIAYKQIGRRDEAADAFQRALRVDGAYGAALRNLAVLHEDAGAFTEAVECYRRALANDPADAKSLAGIVASRAVPANPEEVAAAQELLEAPAVGDDARAQLHYALGKYHDRAGEPDRALSHFRRANALKADPRGDAGAVVRKRVDGLCAVFTGELFERLGGAGHPSEKPVFVVGMPRSGTTLVEQILSSHPRVAGGGELPYFGALALGFPERTGCRFPDGVAAMDAATIDAMARPYLEDLERIDPAAHRVVDKMPQNFLHLGLIALLFENARIVHCWRDPRDVCLSCFVEDFASGHAFASNAEDFASYYREYWRLMAHWRAVLPLPIFDLRYEDLVERFEPTARQLLEFLDCEWDERCLRYYEQDRSVSTPSRWQVRQPIYTSSVGRWRRYRAYLDPVLGQLSAFAEAGPPGTNVLSVRNTVTD